MIGSSSDCTGPNSGSTALPFVLVLMLTLVSGTPRAEELRLCGVEWPPFTYANEEGTQITRGISYEIYTEAFSRLSLPFQADVYPWKRCLSYVEAGQYDAIMDATARDHFHIGKNPTAVYPLAIHVRADYPAEHFNWESFQGHSVGMVHGYNYTPRIRNFKDWTPVYSYDEVSMIRLLQLERLDFILLDIFSAPEYAKKLKFPMRALRPMVDSDRLYLAFHKDRREIADRFDRVLGNLIADGTVEKIYARYGFEYAEVMQGAEEPVD